MHHMHSSPNILMSTLLYSMDNLWTDLQSRSAVGLICSEGKQRLKSCPSQRALQRPPLRLVRERVHLCHAGQTGIASCLDTTVDGLLTRMAFEGHHQSTGPLKYHSELQTATP